MMFIQLIAADDKVVALSLELCKLRGVTAASGSCRRVPMTSNDNLAMPAVKPRRGRSAEQPMQGKRLGT